MKLSHPSTTRPYAKIASQVFAWLCAGCTWLCMILLALLLWKIFQFAWERLDRNLIVNFPTSRLSRIHEAGILSPLVGSLYLIFLTALIAVPIGIGIVSKNLIRNTDEVKER